MPNTPTPILYKADLDLGKGCYRAGVEVNVYVRFDTCVDIDVEFT